MSCVLALGLFPLAQRPPALADIAFAQHLMQRAWLDSGYVDLKAIEDRWPGAFPVMRLMTGDGDVDLVVLAGTHERTLALGPGHLATSATPGGAGNTVITGRCDIYFRFLSNLETGAELRVETLAGQDYAYRVVDIDVVDARRARVELDTPESMLTLVSAYPFDRGESGSGLRYVVTATMIR